LSHHVSEEFKAATNILALLRSDLAEDRFAPKVWKGLEKVQPLELMFKPTMPESLEPKARPINPRS
jgi:hypothetical protein